MEKLKQITKKRWIWGIGVCLACALAFVGAINARENNQVHAASMTFRCASTNQTGTEFTMRHSTDIFYILPSESGDNDSGDNDSGSSLGESVSYTWSSSAESIITVGDGSGGDTEPSGASVVLSVGSTTGSATVTCTISGSTDGEYDGSYYLYITVDFSINEFLDGVTGAQITTLYSTDEKSSLVLDYNAVVPIGTNGDGTDGYGTGSNFLQLIFGNGQNATWSSGNNDVVMPGTNAEGNKVIQATGAGRTTLTAVYNNDGTNLTATIDVYVRPQITYNGGGATAYVGDDGDNDGGNGGDTGNEVTADDDQIVAGGVVQYTADEDNTSYGVSVSGAVTVSNGDYLGVSISNYYHPEIGANDKVIWVVLEAGTGSSSGTEVLVRDSLGNKGADADNINLIYSETENAYRVDAKSGIYTVQFYVAGTYTSFEATQGSYDDGSKCSVGAINVGLSVSCNFSDKNITLSLGSLYDLSTALNISLEDLQAYFTVTISPEDTDLIKLTYLSDDGDSWVVTTGEYNTLGTATLTVSLKDSSNADKFPGLTTLANINSGNPTSANNGNTKSAESAAGAVNFKKDVGASYYYITVTITVDNTFTLNITQTNLSVGDSVYLIGVIGTGETSASDNFVWSTSDSEGKYISLDTTHGQYTNVTAKKYETEHETQTVSLQWTDTKNVTWVASCKITIYSAASGFKLAGNSTMQVGETQLLSTDITTSQDIVWMSSDTNIATVTPNAGNYTANVKAVKNTGDVIITAFNRSNNYYATFKITVSAPITAISIKEGTKTYADGSSLEVSSGVAYVFLTAAYSPSNATDTDMVWTSSKTSVATVDNNGMVTVKSEGDTYITVKPAYNPNGVSANIVLSVVANPITSIKADTSKVSLVVGETYTVSIEIQPAAPSDSTLTWTSSDPSVATVDSNGTIRGVSAGNATILIEGGIATPQMIAVAVRDKIDGIAFADTYVEIEVGESYALEVLFAPDSDSLNKNLSFTTTDSSVATVSTDGVVTGVKEGLAMVTCVPEDLGMEGMITCTISVTAKKIPATGFSIYPTDVVIKAGQSFVIEPTFIPSNTSDQTVEYVSYNESVATVTEDGVVTGVSRGYSIIECTALASGLSELCYVTVEGGITLTIPAEKVIPKGQSYKIKATVDPIETLDTDTLKWKSSDKTIATVNKNGKVKAKKKGSCIITCTLVDNDISAYCTVTVEKLSTSMKLNSKNIRMNVGSTYKLKPTVTTNSVTAPKVTYKSSKPTVAKVGKKSGKITAKKVGSATVTAKTSDGLAKAKCKVSVIRRSTGIKLNKTYATCYVGSTLKLKATVKPASASVKTVKWKSSDKSVASVSGGKVTGYSVGEATITATTTDGSNKKARCLVKVEESVATSSVVISQADTTIKKGDSFKLSYSVLPSNHTDKIKFSSDNKRVAKVNSKGKVTGVGTGVANITILSESGVSNSATVHVVALNKKSVTMRQYDTETIVVNGTSDTITWYSENNRIATVNGGTITGRAEGTTTIYAYVDGCRLSCKVTITSVNS